MNNSVALWQLWETTSLWGLTETRPAAAAPAQRMSSGATSPEAASYTIAAGSIDASNRNVVVTVTDDAGNVTTIMDDANATVDNIEPTLLECVGRVGCKWLRHRTAHAHLQRTR